MASANFDKKQLPKRSHDLSAWYNRVVLQAELADYGPAKGTMIFRPYGYRIWELLQQAMDPLIKAKGVDNAYFPLFIPESLFNKEKAHIKGFAPELAVVTIGGGEELADKLIVRPTSETVMYEAYSRWVQSYRDLPIMINQWNNVVRWEKRTYLFLRTTEFLWQEGHTAHATHAEAGAIVNWAAEMYAQIYREYFAIAGYLGSKSEAEKFAGGDRTITYETLMPEGKALQSATSHDLGQNFSKVFDISFQTADKKTDYAWQTSWGLSSRSLGAMVMVHGDDAGLRLPPKLAPIQVVLLPIRAETPLIKYCQELAGQLTTVGLRVRVDERDERIGFKHNDWELKGVPVRIEVGAKEIESGELSLIRRDNNERSQVAAADLSGHLPVLLGHIQTSLYKQSLQYLQKNTHQVDSYDEFKRIMTKDKGFIRAFWCENQDCADKVKEETKATIRCLPLDAKEERGECILCGKKASHRWLFAQAY